MEGGRDRSFYPVEGGRDRSFDPGRNRHTTRWSYYDVLWEIVALNRDQQYRGPLGTDTD